VHTRSQDWLVHPAGRAGSRSRDRPREDGEGGGGTEVQVEVSRGPPQGRLNRGLLSILPAYPHFWTALFLNYCSKVHNEAARRSHIPLIRAGVRMSFEAIFLLSQPAFSSQ